jgi:IS30 family transposase
LEEHIVGGNTYTGLSLEERTMIHKQLELGIKSAAMAMGVNRPASTQSRELRRNGGTRPTTRRKCYEMYRIDVDT